jgi:hypothetical protein
MCNGKRPLSIWLLVLLASVSLSALAADCFQPSPNFARQKDAYYNLVSPDSVPVKDQKQMVALASALGQHLSGQGHRVECLGSEKAPRLNYVDTQVQADVQASLAEGLVLRSDFTNLKTKVKQADKWAFWGAAAVFNFVKLGEGHYAFVQKLRHRRQAVNSTAQNADQTTGLVTGSGLEEMFVDIQFFDKTLELTIDRYINGFYYATDRLTLGR